MNQVGSQKANAWCLELVFLHDILIGWRQLSSPKAEPRGRRRGRLHVHTGVRRSGEWALRGFTRWGKSKAETVEQTVKSRRGGELGRSCQTTREQERHGCNF